jgi:hypothetical protein
LHDNKYHSQCYLQGDGHTYKLTNLQTYKLTYTQIFSQYSGISSHSFGRLYWFINHDSSEAGNRTLQAFSNILSLIDSNKAKLQALVEEINTVILATNSSRNIMIIHFPKNCGDTRTHPNNKVACMLGLGPQAICALLDLNTALADLSIVVPLVEDLAGCN